MSTFVSIAWIPLKDGAASDPAMAELKGVKDQKLSTPGLEHAFVGRALDPNEPAAIELFDVWSSVDAARAAGTSGPAAEIAKLVTKVQDPSKPAVHNLFELHGEFVKVAKAPVVQVAATSVDPSKTSEFEAAFKEVAGKRGHPAGFVGHAAGWGGKEVDHPEHGKVKVFLALSGWESEAQAKEGTANADAGAVKGLVKSSHVRYTVLTQEK